jgi:hypothetical protein
MEAECSSETLVDFRLTTRRYIPEERAHHLGMNVDAVYFVVETWRQKNQTNNIGCYYYY